MRLVCPKRRAEIEPDQVNVASDLAKCARCNELFKASELAWADGKTVGLDPPPGTKITFTGQRGGRGVFGIPRRGFRFVDTAGAVFATFWLSFVCFWSWGAAHASVFFALFSTPFWLVGLGIWYTILNLVTERQRVELGESQIIVEKRSAFSGERIEVRYEDILRVGRADYAASGTFEAIRLAGCRRRLVKTRANQSYGVIDLPAISHGAETTLFAEHCGEAEQAWLIHVIRAFVSAKTGRRA